MSNQSTLFPWEEEAGESENDHTQAPRIDSEPSSPAMVRDFPQGRCAQLSDTSRPDLERGKPKNEGVNDGVSGEVSEGGPLDRVTGQSLAELGHFRKPVLAAVREKCLQCCEDLIAEVRHCPVTRCPLWPFRMRKNPYRAPSTTKNLPTQRPADADG